MNFFWNGFTSLKTGRLSGCRSHSLRSLLLAPSNRSSKTQVVRVCHSTETWENCPSCQILQWLQKAAVEGWCWVLNCAVSYRAVTVKPNVWPFFHQRADNDSKARAQATFLKGSYEIISLCKSIKISSDSLSIGRLRGRAEVAGLWCARFNEIPLLLRRSLQIFHISAWERFDAFLPVPRVNWKHFRINSAWGLTLPAHHYS